MIWTAPCTFTPISTTESTSVGRLPHYLVSDRRPRLIEEPLRRHICRLRTDGSTMQAIADKLNSEGIPTVGGGPWQPSTIDRVLKSSHG